MNINDIKWGGSGIEKVVFDAICELLPEGKTILELGSGDCSTNAFLTRYNVISIEQSLEWVNRYPPAKYIYAPIEGDWYEPEAIIKSLKNMNNDYDLIFVDGPLGEGNRAGFFYNLDLFKNNVPIIFHDTYRDAEYQLAMQVAGKLNRHVEFFKNGDFYAIIR